MLHVFWKSVLREEVAGNPRHRLKKPSDLQYRDHPLGSPPNREGPPPSPSRYAFQVNLGSQPKTLLASSISRRDSTQTEGRFAAPARSSRRSREFKFGDPQRDNRELSGFGKFGAEFLGTECRFLVRSGRETGVQKIEAENLGWPVSLEHAQNPHPPPRTSVA